MEKFFRLKENGTDVRTEIIAGLTTFLSMAGVLAINPMILSAAGMDQASVFTATAVSAAVATIVMALFANYPVALASGMGVNIYFAYTICPMVGTERPWEVALAAVLVEGLLFLALSFTKPTTRCACTKTECTSINNITTTTLLTSIVCHDLNVQNSVFSHTFTIPKNSDIACSQ